ncbi:hypothetical protein ACOMHN_043732 [Nucella lapillus]
MAGESSSSTAMSPVLEKGESEEWGMARSGVGDPGLPPQIPSSSAGAAQASRTPVRRQSRVALQDNYFTAKLCGWETMEGDRTEVVAAASNTTLRYALEPLLERRGIDINGVNVFIEKSHTPLPLSSDVTFLAGNTLEIKAEYKGPLMCPRCCP